MLSDKVIKLLSFLYPPYSLLPLCLGNRKSEVAAAKHANAAVDKLRGEVQEHKAQAQEAQQKEQAARTRCAALGRGRCTEYVPD